MLALYRMMLALALQAYCLYVHCREPITLCHASDVLYIGLMDALYIGALARANVMSYYVFMFFYINCLTYLLLLAIVQSFARQVREINLQASLGT